MPEVMASPSAPTRPAGRFPPGVSGNPAGRPKGARKQPQEALEALLRRAGAQHRHGKHIVKALVAAARAGDAAAAAALLAAIQQAGGETPP